MPIDTDIPKELQGGFFSSESNFQNTGRLPETFKRVRNGHSGSHHFLVDDFVKCVNSKKQPLITNAWQAAKYCLPGIIAHQSSVKGGVVLDVPYYGEIPPHFDTLDLDENAFAGKIK